MFFFLFFSESKMRGLNVEPVPQIQRNQRRNPGTGSKSKIYSTFRLKRIKSAVRSKFRNRFSKCRKWTKSMLLLLRKRFQVDKHFIYFFRFNSNLQLLTKKETFESKLREDEDSKYKNAILFVIMINVCFL